MSLDPISVVLRRLLNTIFLLACLPAVASAATVWLNEGNGAVVVQVANNGARLTREVPAFTRVTVVDVHDEDRKFALESVPEGVTSSRIFAADIPPGTYRIASLGGSEQIGDYLYSLDLPLDERLGWFQVEPGALSDLGTLIFQKIGSGEDAAYVAVRADDVLALSDLRTSIFGRSAGRVEQVVEGWIPRTMEEEDPKIAESIMGNIVELGGFALGVHDELLTWGKFGQILSRDAEGFWHGHDLGMRIEVSQVLTHGGRYIVIGERGVVLTSESLDGPWLDLSIPRPEYAMILAGIFGDGRLYVAGETDDRLALFRNSLEPGADWELILSEEQRMSRGGFILVTDDQLLFKTSSGRMRSYDPEADRWRGTSTHFETVSQSLNGLYAGTDTSWGSEPFPVVADSKDLTDDWIELKGIVALEDPTLAADGSVYVLGYPERTGREKRRSEERPDYAIWRHHPDPDEGDWERLWDIPRHCYPEHLAVHQGGLFTACAFNGQIHRLDLDAVTDDWFIERRPFVDEIEGREETEDDAEVST